MKRMLPMPKETPVRMTLEAERMSLAPSVGESIVVPTLATVSVVPAVAEAVVTASVVPIVAPNVVVDV